MVDGLVRYRFGDNAGLMGAWASPRNVVGPLKSKAIRPCYGVALNNSILPLAIVPVQLLVPW